MNYYQSPVKIFKIIDSIYFLFILSVVIIYFKFYELNVDSNWILYVGSQLLNGKTLYIDISEVNPPLIFIYSVFVNFVANLLNFDVLNTYLIMVGILITISTYLCFLLIKNIETLNKYSRFYIYSIIFILTILILNDFTQREHLLLIFIFPYVLFSMYRYQYNFSRYLIFSIILFASFGLNLKPHFFLLVIFIEFIYIFHLKKILNFLRWDFFLLISTSLFYILIVFLFFPEFFNFGLPLAIKTYLDLFNVPFYSLFLNYEILILIFTFILYFLSKENNTLDNKILIASILAYLIVYLIQQKGWFYHRIPLYGFSLFFILHLYKHYLKSNKIYSFALLPILILVTYFNLNQKPRFEELNTIVKSLPDNTKIHVISTGIGRSLAVLKKSQKWSSRFGALGILNHIILTDDKEVENYLINSIYEDLLIYKPDFIILCSDYDGFDYYNYFIEKNKTIKKIYSINYKKSIIDGYTILEKIKEF